MRVSSPFRVESSGHPFSEFVFLDRTSRDFAVLLAEHTSAVSLPRAVSPDTSEAAAPRAESSNFPVVRRSISPEVKVQPDKQAPTRIKTTLKSPKETVSSGAIKAGKCGVKACVEVRRMLAKAKSTLASDRASLLEEIEQASMLLEPLLAELSGVERELEVFVSEGEELERQQSQLRRSLEALQSRQLAQTQEQEALRRDKEGADMERQRVAQRLRRAEEELADLMWRRESRTDTLDARPPSELVFSRQSGRTCETLHEDLADYSASAEQRLLDLVELRLRKGGRRSSVPPRSLPALSGSLHSRLSSPSLCFSFKGYTPTGCHWRPEEASRRIQLRLLGEDESSAAETPQSPLDPIHFRPRARSSWGRRNKVGAVRTAGAPQLQARVTPLAAVPRLTSAASPHQDEHLTHHHRGRGHGGHLDDDSL